MAGKTQTAPVRRLSTKELKLTARKKDEKLQNQKAQAHHAYFRTLHASLPLPWRVFFVCLLFIVFACVVIYPVARPYYQQVREEQRTSAILEAQLAANEQQSAENEYLKTDEGIEDQATKNFGWVKEGDEAAVVSNADDIKDGDDEQSWTQTAQIDEDTIHAPQTWYYDILDTIFFVKDV